MGKSVLIIGGGPTTLEKERWQDINVDEIVTVSTAYLNKDLHKLKSTYHIISTQTEFDHPLFSEWYANNKQCKFIVEGNHLWRRPKGMDEFDFVDDPIEIRIDTEFGIGIMSRAIIWAIGTEQYSDVYFVGFDGYSVDGKGQHAFRSEISQLDPAASFNTYQMYLNNFTSFNKYIESLLEVNNCKVHNLGKGHPSNILSHIQSKVF